MTMVTTPQVLVLNMVQPVLLMACLVNAELVAMPVVCKAQIQVAVAGIKIMAEKEMAMALEMEMEVTVAKEDRLEDKMEVNNLL